ncbi:unnamed protein product [Alopecurus aequalis]
MAAADGLSALADDILQRILSFLLLRDAAASAILSRRWRPLWRRTSFLNLDSRLYFSSFRLRDPRFDAFFHHASAALADHRTGTELRRLTLVLTEDAYLRRGEDYYWMHDVEPEQDVLEIDGTLNDCSVALAMATLLRSCPAIAELRVRLSNWEDFYVREDSEDPFAQSMERFSRFASMCSAHRDIVEFGGVSELPDAFTNNCSFSYLQKVTLQFKSTKPNCFQVQLAKFLVENAMVLEEMHIQDGSQFWTDHLLHKVARWRADAFHRKNLTDTAGFRVYQMANLE